MARIIISLETDSIKDLASGKEVEIPIGKHNFDNLVSVVLRSKEVTGNEIL